MKGNEDMKRIVAIAGAFLVMFIIIGISGCSIRNIDKKNQKNQEEQQGINFAATIAQTEATTNIWEYLRSTTAESTETTLEAVEGETLASGETLPAQEQNAESTENTEGVVNDPQTSSEQTVTATVPVGEESQLDQEVTE